ARRRAPSRGAGCMNDVWSARAELYVESDAHRTGDDLELLVAWARGARTALDVPTGAGHVARRLREEGIDVVTCDPAPGMNPEAEWRALVTGADLQIDEMRFTTSTFDFGAWLARTDCGGATADRVRELWGERVADDRLTLDKIAILAATR